MRGARHARTGASPFYVLAFLLFYVLSSMSQETGFYVSGRVMDEDSDEPLENVSILVRNTNRGTTTNELGEFLIQVTQLPFQLEFSHVAYENKTLRFSHKPLQPLSVRLSSKVEFLSGVTITAQRIDTLFADQVYSVLDYELCDRGILLLIFRSRLSRSELRLQDYSGKTLAEKRILPMKPLGLYRDCLGEVHILSQDKAYQVSVEDDKLSLLPPYNIDYFAEVMAGCQFMIGARVFFEDITFNELIKRFYVVNSLDTTSTMFAISADEEKIAFMRQNPGNYNNSSRGQESELLSKLNGSPEDRNTLDAIRNLDATTRFIKMAFLSAIYAPLFAMGDSVVLFNHPMDVIQFYDTLGNLTGETPIDYHRIGEDNPSPGLVYALTKSDKWLKQVYVDRTGNKAYTTFRNLDGTRDLDEIDLVTGEVRFTQLIPFPYVQKLKVQDGYLYYIYKGYGQSQRKKLFRQRIN